MDLTAFSPDIVKDLKYLAENRLKAPRGYISTCRRVMKTGKSIGSKFLYGAGCYYAANYYYMNSDDYRPAERYLGQAIVNLLETGEATLLSRTYGLLGIDSANRGLNNIAFDYCYQACSWAEVSGDSELSAISEFNLGVQYGVLGDYTNKKKHCDLAAKFARQCSKKNPYYYSINFYCMAEMGITATIKNKYKDAEKVLHKMEAFIKRAPDDIRIDFENDPVYLIILAKYNIHIKEHEKAAVCTDKLTNLVNSGMITIDTLEDVINFLDFLVDNRESDSINKLLSALKPKIKSLGIAYLEMKYYTSGVRFARLSGCRDEEFACSEGYFDAYDRYCNDQNSANETFISLYHMMLKVKKENVRLERLASHDALTDLPNRNFMRPEIDSAFEEAYNFKKLVAIEIMDIDDFKKYNDTYGHDAGDKCLCAVAEVLKKAAEAENIDVFRYGGDEFVVLYTNMTEYEILEAAEKIRDDVLDIRIKSADGRNIEKISVSQGISCFIPMNMNKTWDFFYGADFALYKQKNDAKGGICINHGINAERLMNYKI